ncbi:FAD-binding protein [Hydrogenophilus islandicus]
MAHRVLVIAEHNDETLLSSTAHTVAAAKILGEVVVLVAGKGCTGAAEAAAKLDGVVKVLHADAPELDGHTAEAVTDAVLAASSGFRYLLFPSTAFGKNCAPRVAAKLDRAQISDVVRILDEKTFVRPIYAGNALATVTCDDEPLVLTIRTTAFDAVATRDAVAPIERLSVTFTGPKVTVVSRELTQSARPELTSARVIVTGGRGLGSAEQFHALLEPLADKLNAAIGASRAAVDAGYAPNDWQVGQTGKIVAPELYFAIGVSGAIQHLAGMKDSKVIVAINKDPEAPIFQVADYGLVADLFEAVPELTKKL